MRTSESIAKLTEALIKARAEFEAVVKSAAPETGPLKGKKYATLDDVIDATVPALLNNGLMLLHGGAENGTLATRLLHKSGEWIETYTPVFEGQQKGAQGYGSGITYARRYAAMALLNVAPEDDDGAAADGQQVQTQNAPTEEEKRAAQEDWAARFCRAMQDCETVEAIDALWGKHWRDRISHLLQPLIDTCDEQRRAAKERLTGITPPAPPQRVNGETAHANGHTEGAPF